MRLLHSVGNMRIRFDVRKLMRVLFILICGLNQIVLADHVSASFETGAAGAIMTTPGATLPKCKFVVGIGVTF